MTKTESAEKLIKTLVIESCEQLLEFHAGAGVRLAIPNTDALIMVGPADWIAKNVPGVEAMVEGSSNALHNAIMNLPCERTMSHFATRDYLIAYKEGHRDARHAAAELSLAATTQASTAQAERDDAGFLKHWDAVSYAYGGSTYYDLAYKAARAAWFAATSSTDAQAAAEVRDAALEEAAQIVDAAHREQHWSSWHLFKPVCDAIRALKRAGDTGEQADGGAR